MAPANAKAIAAKGEGAELASTASRACITSVTHHVENATTHDDLAVAEASRLVGAGYRVQTVVSGEKHPANMGHGKAHPVYSATPDDFHGRDLAVICGPCTAVGSGHWLVLLDRDGEAPWDAYGFPRSLPATVSSKNDHHRFYIAPADCGLKGWTDCFHTKAATGSALDLSTAGKLAFEYPSTNSSGARVEWDGAPLGASGGHPAELPQWAIDHILSARRARARAMTTEARAIACTAAVDGARTSLDLARRFARTCPPSIEGQGGDSALFMAAVGVIRGCALDLETGLAILRDEFNPRCQPPWGDDRLSYKAQQAFDESDAPTGYLLPSPDRDECERLFALADESQHVPLTVDELGALATKERRRQRGDHAAATALRAIRDGEAVTPAQRRRALLAVYRAEPLTSPESAAAVLGVALQAANTALYAPLVASYEANTPSADADAAGDPEFVLDAAKTFLAATRYIHAADRGMWMHHDGQRWVEVHDAMAKLDGLLPHGRLRDRAPSVLSNAAALRPVKQDAFDPRGLLNCENGTLELDSLEFRPHSPDDLCTTVAPVNYAAGAQHAFWNQYIADLTCGDRDLAVYLQRAVGYSLVADGSEKVAFFAHGASNSGKTLFVRVLSRLLGGGGQSENASTFIQRFRSASHSEDRASLAGKRIVVVDEFPAGAEFDVEFINRVTGGMAISSSHKGGRQFTWTPRFALWFASETAPESNAAVHGFRNRLRVVPFSAQFAHDPAFWDALTRPEVLSAALQWAVDGVLAYRANGLGSCAAVDAAREVYAQANTHSVDLFVESRCTREPDAWTSVLDLHAAYREFCGRHGVKHTESVNDFAARLTKLGFEVRRRGRLKVSGRQGIRLLTQNELSGRDDASPKGGASWVAN